MSEFREVVKCQVLNRHSIELYHPSTLEVIIGFDGQGNPMRIMCDSYDAKNKVCEIKAEDSNYKSKECTYAKWKELGLPEEAE